MKRSLLLIGTISICVGLLFSGAQTVTGYYADPSGYGFHHLSYGYLYVSISMTILGGIALVLFLGRLADKLF